MNNLQLKAQRQALGLTVAEACKLVKNKDGQPLSKRMWQYYEQGKHLAHDGIDITIFGLASHYTLLLDKLTADIDKFNKHNSKPITDDADEYFEQLKSVKKLVLPFWHSFEQFKADTGNQSQAHWKIWQAVIGHLMLIGKLNYLDDSAKVPTDFGVWRWLKGDYIMEINNGS